MKFLSGLLLGVVLGWGGSGLVVKSIPPTPLEVIPAPAKFLVKRHNLYAFGNTHLMYTGLTAYNAGEITSIGKLPNPNRTIAVDPRIIPYGSRVFIPSIGWRIAEDTGGDIKGNRIDIFMSSEEKAIQFGRKSALVLWESK